MNKYEYLTDEYRAKTKYKSIRDAIDRDYFSVVCYHGAIWIESRLCPPSLYRRAKDELMQLYPDMWYIHPLGDHK